MAAKIIIIESCIQCPGYDTENNVLRHGSVGEVARCKYQNKEIEFTDKMDVPKTYSEVHRSCPLQSY